MNLTRKTRKQPKQSDRSTPSARPTSSRLAIALSSLIGLIGLSFAPGSNVWAKEKAATPPTKAEVAEKKDDLKELRGQIESLRKDVAAAARTGYAERQAQQTARGT